MSWPERGLHLDCEQMLLVQVEKEEIDSVQAGAWQVPNGVPSVFEENALDDCLGDVARGASAALQEAAFQSRRVTA